MNVCQKFGNYLKMSVRGASHAPCLTFTLENFPAGFSIDTAALKTFMERRAPGRDELSTTRNEPDEVVFDQGVNRRSPPSFSPSDCVTTGDTIHGHIDNTNIRPADYGHERTVPRPGHADFPQWIEAGRIPTGGGSNSGRLTAALCAVGGLCKQFLARRGIAVNARIEQIHGNASDPNREILEAKKNLDSVGGTIVCEATGMPAGLGGALFGGIETELAGALFAVPGLKGVEFGNGFACTELTGAENDDAFIVENGEVKTVTNRQGGILGGRSSGMPIVFRVAMRPTPTVYKTLQSIDLKTMTSADLAMKGRHDPCITRRAVPVIEAVTAFTLADIILATEAACPRICLTVTGTSLDEDVAQYESQRYFTDIVELRLDHLTDEERAKAADFPCRVKVPVIFTYRRKVDGGIYEGSEEDRVAYFKALLERLGRETRDGRREVFVDFEDDFRVNELSALAETAGVTVIRSQHDFNGPVTDIANVCRRMRGATREIPKVAFMPKTVADVERLFAETKDFTDIPHILCAMGSLGFVSRVRAVETHSLLTYTSLGALGQIGHVTPHELVKTFRFRTLPRGAEVIRLPAEDVPLANAKFAAADEDEVAIPLTVMG